MRPSEAPSEPLFTPWRLALVAQVSFVVFLCMVISASLPPRLLNPAWQSSLIGSVLSFALYPLLGLGLLHLAADLTPEDERLSRRRQLCARLAAPVSLAFVLLIPLQVFSQVQQIRTVQSTYNNQVVRQEQLVANLGRLVNTAASSEAIFEGLQALKAPTPPSAYRSLPLVALKGRMQADLVVARQQLLQIRAGAPRPNLWAAAGLITRNSLLSLAFALGFAGLAQRRGGSLPLLEEWTMGLAQRIARLEANRRSLRRGSPREGLASYVEELSRDQERHSKS